MTRRSLVLLTGSIGAGKTTVAERVVELALRRGIACRGLLAPGLRDAGGRKAGILGIDLGTREQRTLARTDRDLGGPRLGPYSFDAAALEWAAAAVVKGLTSSLGLGEVGDPYAESVCFVDEIGPLELHRGEGLAAVLPVLAGGRVGRVLVIVRDSLLGELQERLKEAEPVVFRADDQSRDALPGKVLEALL